MLLVIIKVFTTKYSWSLWQSYNKQLLSYEISNYVLVYWHLGIYPCNNSSLFYNTLFVERYINKTDDSLLMDKCPLPFKQYDYHLLWILILKHEELCITYAFSYHLWLVVVSKVALVCLHKSVTILSKMKYAPE